MSTQDQGQSDSNLVQTAVETKDVYEDHKDTPETDRQEKKKSTVTAEINKSEQV